MKVEFKRLTLDDIEEAINLCNDCFEEFTNLEYAKEVFNKTKDSSNNIYIIWIFNNEIVSHAKITIIDTIYENMGTYAILNHVCVKKDYRRHKIATKMLDEITKICLNNNCRSIKLWSKNTRTAAHLCYKKYGFASA